MRRGIVRLLEADDAVLGPLAAGGAEEHDRRRPEDAEALQQRLVLGVVGGDVGLQQHGARESACTPASVKV